MRINTKHTKRNELHIKKKDKNSYEQQIWDATTRLMKNYDDDFCNQKKVHMERTLTNDKVRMSCKKMKMAAREKSGNIWIEWTRQRQKPASFEWMPIFFPLISLLFRSNKNAHFSVCLSLVLSRSEDKRYSRTCSHGFYRAMFFCVLPSSFIAVFWL